MAMTSTTDRLNTTTKQVRKLLADLYELDMGVFDLASLSELLVALAEGGHTLAYAGEQVYDKAPKASPLRSLEGHSVDFHLSMAGQEFDTAGYFATRARYAAGRSKLG